MKEIIEKFRRLGPKKSLEAVVFKVRKQKAYFFIFLSRKILKNEGGFDLYLWGKAKHAVASFLSNSNGLSTPLDTDSVNKLKFLKKNKYVTFSPKISSELLFSIREKLDKYIVDDDYSHPRGQLVGSGGKKIYSRAMSCLLENIPEVKDILTPDLINFVRHYYGSNLGITSVLCWRNYHVPDEVLSNVVYSNDWHNDYISPVELKLFINITDVTEEDGPLHVISGPKSRELISSSHYDGRFAANDVESIENPENLVKHIGRGGAGIFCHASYCLHRAGIPAKGRYRDILEFQFHPSSRPLPENWEKQNLLHK